MKPWWLPVFIILLCFKAQTLEASPYLRHFPEEVQKRLAPHIQEGQYQGVDNKINHFTYFEDLNNKITTPLILVTGLEDPIPLWFLTVEKALAFGFQRIAVVEIRGQGQSEMVLPGKRLIYIQDFDNYVKDFLSFLKKMFLLGPEWLEPAFVVSHSTGALVVANALPRWEKEFPKTYPRKLAFWTPFFKLKISPLINNTLVRGFLKTVDSSLSYFSSPFLVRHYKPKEFRKNSITTDQKNFALSQTMKFDEGLGTEGLSLHWVLETLEAIDVFRENQKNWLQVPTLLFKAEIEQIVDNNYDLENPFVKEVFVSHAKHALNLEKPKTLSKVTKKTFEFFSKE